MNKAIQRILERYPYLDKRKFGFPDIGLRKDKNEFSPYVKEVKDAFDIYDYLLNNYYDPNKDINMTSGNPMEYNPYPPIVKNINKYLKTNDLYKYPYSEGDNKVRKVLLDYIERIGFKNDDPYKENDIDKYGLSINNLTMTVSTSHAVNILFDIIAREHDVVLMTAPNYGLFSFKPERFNVDVRIIPLKEEDNYLINPNDLESIIDKTNKELKEKYENLDYTPKVVAIINSNPSNPLGTFLGEIEKDRLTKIGDIVLKNDIFIIDDLIYRDISFNDDLALPFGTLDGMFKNTISLFGLSKSYGMASLRAGFVVADEVIIREIINRIFCEFDAVPAIIGVALEGAFEENKCEYNKYFNDLRYKYALNYNLFKCLIDGYDSIDKKYQKEVYSLIKKYAPNYDIYKGIKDIKIKVDVKSGFFVIVDFTKLKGKIDEFGKPILTEEDLLLYFYRNVNLRFLIGKSFAWPNKDELVGRFTFAKLQKEIINCVVKMNEAIDKLM